MKKKSALILFVLMSSIIIPLISIPVVYANPGQYFWEYFENWNDNAWRISASGVDPESTSAKYGGLYGMEVNSGASGYKYIYFNEYYPVPGYPGGNVMRLTGKFNLKNMVGTSTLGIFEFLDGSYTTLMELFINPEVSGTEWWLDATTYFSGDTLLMEIEKDHWYEYEVVYERGSSGYCVGWITDLDTGETTELFDWDENNSGEDAPRYLYVGKLTSSTIATLDLYFDDIKLSDTPGKYREVVSVTADLEPDNSLEDIDWVFTDWRYYTFTMTVPSITVDYAYLGLTNIRLSNASAGRAGFSMWTDQDAYYWALNIQDPQRKLDPVYGGGGTWEEGESTTVITFLIWFTDDCLDMYEADDCVSVYAWYNETGGAESGWVLCQANYFHVYNTGGFSRYYDYDEGSSGTLPGGRDFNMYAYNNSEAYKDLWWRDLTHIKMVPEIQFRAGYQYFNLYWSIDYLMKDGSYTTGMKLLIVPDAVSYTGVFASNVWINYTAYWYVNNELVKEEDLYAFYHGDVYSAGDYGRVKFYIDFWFDSGNASSLMGGRINAYEYPMQDSSGAWLRWLSSNWGVKDDVLKQSECMVPVFDYPDVDVPVACENIEFVRILCGVEVPADEYNQYVAVINYDVFETTFSTEKGVIHGIDTPPWDETNMPVMKNTGVLGAVWSMFQGIGQWLSENILFGGLNLWGTFVAFLDTIAGWLGAPGFFTNLFAYLGVLFGNFLTGVGYALQLVYEFFVMIAMFIGTFITTLAELVLSIGNTIGGIIDIMGGTIGGAGNLWETFGISTWLTVALIFYPIYLIILWEEKGMDAVIAQLTMIFGIAVWLWGFFIGLGQFILNLVTGLIESIPVAE